MRLSYLLLFGVNLMVTIASAQQNNLAIGQWRSHLPYQSGRYVTQSSEKVFYATEWSILSLNKADFAVDFLSTVNGLSNTGIRLIKYHQTSGTLIVVYENSVIDLIQEDRVTTLNQIKNFSNIVGAKIIYDVVPENDSMVYLAASYGVSKLNLLSQEFTFSTFFPGIEVRALALFNGDIYAGTVEGVFTTSTQNVIPEDFRSWDLLQETAGFPMIYRTTKMVTYNNFLILEIDGEIHQLDSEGRLTFLHNEPDHRLQYLTAEGPDLLAGYRCRLSNCTDGKVLAFNENFVYQEIEACTDQVLYGIQESNGSVFLADEFRQFRIIDNPQNGNCTALQFSSPFTHKLREIAIGNDQVWVTAGGLTQTFSNNFSQNGFFRLQDGRWTNFNRGNTEVLYGQNGIRDGEDDLLDFITVAIHPLNGKVFLGSFYEGMVEFDGENFTLINENNSTLGEAQGDNLRVRVSGLAFDQENNLWVANHLSESPLSVLTAEGNWQSFRPSCGRTEIHQIAIDADGNKWIVDASSGAGVIVFDEGDLKDPNDDQCRIITQNNSNLTTNRTNCIVADLDGVIWIGTTQGISIFDCRGDAFNENCVGSNTIFSLEGENFGEFLLEREDVQTIAVDGANRKWIGTKNGVFILSADGREEVLRFTSENSPLFDNNVLDIAINPGNGEVFIGTDKGLISYKSDATQGGRVNRSAIKVYPNPVKPSYTGPIAIEGLARDADVKITNITGELVFETQALGGQAVWDGNDYNGRRVSTGVYLVFSTQQVSAFDTFQPDAAIARIVVIN